MRKTRLVILPTKCLHQMGFLLLFLSCPVIGDWGRIRPDNENLHRAIEVEREGTCGLQRDTPGGFHDFANERGLNIRQFRENDDLSIHRMSRFNERRDSRRLTRDRFDERRERSIEFRRDRDFQERSIRSRSAESRRNDRVDIRGRSLSLSRLEAFRRQTDSERRSGERRLSLARRMNEENERRIEHREGERISPIQNERSRSSQRRENERSVQRLSLQRREDEIRRQDRDIREGTERRLSLSRTEENLRKIQRTQDGRTADRATLERHTEMNKSRKDVRNEGEKTLKMKRNVSSRREVDNRKQIKSGQNAKDERRIEILNRRVSEVIKHQVFYPEDKTESFFMGAMKWLNFENYETPTIGDWSSNCMIGAVAYYLSMRQTKTV